MPALVLLNGPPAVGKSTLAGRLVAIRPLALNLDIDVVRHHLGRWQDQPDDAGRAARDLAAAMAATHLGAGFDVVIPQYLGRLDFVTRLETVAAESGATFREVVLMLSRDGAGAAYERREAEGRDPIHAGENPHVDRSSRPDPVGELYDRLQGRLAARPADAVVSRQGDVDTTLAALLAALAACGVDW